jgi:phosphotriesterase-related protein
MAEIMTVRGPIAPEELGFTSMHEHILWDGRVYREKYEAALPDDLPIGADDPVALENVGYHQHCFIMSWDACSMHDEEVMTAEVADFRASGGGALLDMSAPGLRSDLPGIRRISENTDVHIVTSTGLYMEDSWPERFRGMTIEQYVEYMKREIDAGIDGTGIKPGHIKTAIERGLSEGEERLLRAAARVSSDSGLPVTVHLGIPLRRDAGLEIARVMLDEGVDPERVILCHIQHAVTPMDARTLVLEQNSWKLDLAVAENLLDRGFNLSVDCFGHHYGFEPVGFLNQTDWQRLATLVALLRGGYSRQLVIGTDTYLKILVRRFGGHGYCRLAEFVVPTLLQLGVSDEEIRRITVENPARLLAH